MNYTIEFKNPLRRLNIIKCLVALGYHSSPEGTDPIEIDKGMSFYNWITIYPEDRSLGANMYGSTAFKVLTLDDLFLFNNPIEIKLNDEYTAIVSEDGIMVGCHTFPLSIVKSLLEAVQKVQPGFLEIIL